LRLIKEEIVVTLKELNAVLGAFLFPLFLSIPVISAILERPLWITISGGLLAAAELAWAFRAARAARRVTSPRVD
jgi:hypothetical protein